MATPLKPVTTHTPPSKCLHCGHLNDAATAVTAHETPKPGDIMVCLYCGHVMAFALDLTMRDLNDQEAHYVAGNREILRLQRLRGYVMDKKRKPHGEKTDDQA